MSELAILDQEKYITIPLRGLMESTRNELIIKLGEWLEGLLSLEGEKSAKRLEVLLPMIKNSAWGMSIEEIKKAFEYYVEGNLSIEPRDNYLTAILFSKVIKEYKSKYLIKKLNLLPVKTPMGDQEIDEIMIKAVESAKKEYQEKGNLNNGAIGQYKWLDEKGKFLEGFGLTKDEWNQKKRGQYSSTKKLLEAVYKSEKPTTKDEKLQIKNTLKELEKYPNGEVVSESKKSILKEYYSL